MDRSAPACFIGLDMGTTNTRAWCIVAGEIVASARAAVGIRDAAVSGGPEVLREAMRSLVAELRDREGPGRLEAKAVVAAGMITSNLGLAEVPHLAAPAGLGELAAGVERRNPPELEGLPLYLIPGVSTGPPELEPEEIHRADVMRGEETLCVGLLAARLLPAGGTLLNLGSHWKAVRVDGSGRIAGSSTALTGELLHAAQTRTVLAGSVPGDRPERLDLRWARAGLAEARRSGLERALFCVRLLDQRSTGSPEARLSYLIGAFVGSALPWVLAEAAPDKPLVIAGGGPIASLFAEVLRPEGLEARTLSREQVEAAMARGLGLVAKAVVGGGG